MSQLDQVIAADNAIAHLAGALRIPAWLMLLPKAHWRWLTRRSNTPWYPSLLLFRCKSSAWCATIGEIAEALAIVGHHGAPLAETAPPAALPDPARVEAIACYFAGPGMIIGIALGGDTVAGLGDGAPAVADRAPLLSIPGLRFYALDEVAAMLSRLDLVIATETPLAEFAASLGLSSWLLFDAASRGPATDPNLYVFRRQPNQAWPDIAAQIVPALEAAALPNPIPATV